MSKSTSLQDYWNNASEIETVWFVSTGHPAGKELTHNTETQDPEEYCDINETVEFLGDLEQYTGTINKDGVWEWDGNSGNPTDPQRNTIVNLKVFAK